MLTYTLAYVGDATKYILYYRFFQILESDTNISIDVFSTDRVKIVYKTSILQNALQLQQSTLVEIVKFQKESYSELEIKRT